MPELTGDRLAHRILSIKPGLPVIICTGYSHRLNRAQAEEMGLADFLMKPFSHMELAKTIRRALMIKTVRVV
jgi:FixJ family two-component response regulator